MRQIPEKIFFHNRVVLASFAVLAIGVLLLAPGSCRAQLQQRFDLSSGAGSTVSVATLRIPDKAWKHFARAKAAVEHNRPDESGREIAQAIEIAPDFAQAYLLRADLQIKAHAYTAAIDSVAEARRVEPEIPLAGIILAGAYNGLAQYGQAFAVLEHLRGWEAQSWQASYERARAATGMRDADAALSWSAHCLELAPPNFADVHLVRANALMLARQWSEAELQLRTYLNSAGPLLHRAEVSTALIVVHENASRTAHQDSHADDLVKVASR